MILISLIKIGDGMKKLCYFIFLIVLIGCSSKDFFISPEYKYQKIENATLIIPTLSEFKIRHTENVFDESELTLINKKLVSTISENLKTELFSKTTLAKVEFIDIQNKMKLEDKRLILNGEDSFSMQLPKNKIQAAENDNVFILFIESFSTNIYRKERETSDPAKYFSVSNPTPTETKLAPAKLADQVVGCEFKFLIWDNQNLKPVSYGYVHFENKIGENEEIDSVLKRIVEKISSSVIKDSPFTI